MKTWPIHVLALVVVMHWGGVLQAQQGIDAELGIPPSPQEQRPADRSSRNGPDDEASPTVLPKLTVPEGDTGSTEGVLRGSADQPSENSQDGGLRDRPVARPSAEIEVDPEYEISPRVREATASLDIDDATRARYRWENGEWWFQMDSGQWKYYRDGRWRDFDPATYEPPVRVMDEPSVRMINSRRGRNTHLHPPGEGPDNPLPTHSANSYYYAAPSYRPVPPIYYGPGFGYRGGYYDAPWRRPPVPPIYRGGFDPVFFPF